MVTVITRTIGPSGRDYASFTLAEADVTNIGTSADLVANDEAIVFEADAGTYNETVTISSTLVTDATRQVTYKPAAGSEHGGVFGGGVHIIASGTACFIPYDSHTEFNGLSLLSAEVPIYSLADGLRVESCVIECTSTLSYRQGIIQTKSPTVATRIANTTILCDPAQRSCIEVLANASVAVDMVVLNCTLMGARGIFTQCINQAVTWELVNTLVLGPQAYNASLGTGSLVTTGSNNFGPATQPFPVAIQGSPYPITATTSFSTPLGSGDYAVYMGATGALADVTGNDVWQQGVGPSVNSDVPTTDINGVARSGATCNPGAFEADGFVAPTVLTRTIGSGKDYASFTLAEADVTNIGGSADLTFENEAIVFEADAGTYIGSLTINSTLVTDATRNVTYKPAAGSEHGGVFGAGVHISSTGTTCANYDDFTRFEALSFVGSVVTFAVQAGIGWTVTGCLIHSTTAQYAFFATGNTSSSSRGLLENCVLKQDTNFKAMRFLTGSTNLGYYRAVNNTTVTSSYWEFESRGAALDVELINNINYGPGVFVNLSGGGSVVQSGSNNYSTGSRPWPVALQGSPYPITPTTDTSPGAGDWAIYQASNGQLYNIVENDVWQQGVGPTANADVPATDILGYARYGATANPGAFELGLALPGPYAKPRHFQVNTAADPHAVSLWSPTLRKL